MPRTSGWFVALWAALSVATPTRADDFSFLLGQKPKPFIEPAGFYAVILPTGFDCEARPRRVTCKGNRGVQADLTILVNDVPPSATNEIVLLNEMDRFKQQPHFKMIRQDKTKIDGTPAVTAAFSYDALGNVEYPIGVQALYMVRQNKVYIIHLEMRLDQFATYKNDLAQLYASFKPAKLDGGGNPIIEDLKPNKSANPDGLPEIERALKTKY